MYLAPVVSLSTLADLAQTLIESKYETLYRVTDLECEGPNSLVIQPWNFASTEIWLYTCTHTSSCLPFFLRTAKY